MTESNEARRSGGPSFRGGAAREAVRRLVRNPGLSLGIIATLGLGIGANVALFSVLQSVLLRPLPYPEADRLVRLWETNPTVDDERHGPSPWNFTDWERTAAGFESMASWYLTSGTYRTESWVEEIRSAQVTTDFFRTLGVEPALGRDFQQEEVVRYGPVMLSYGIWQRLFASDPAVVGQTIVSSGNSYRIAGVMPEEFAFPDASVETWVAWNMPSVYEGRPETRTWRFLEGVARLSPETSVDEAEEELDRVALALSEVYPETNNGWDVAVSSLHEETVGDVRGTLWIAFGAVLFSLLIACANVANLLLARVPRRSRELAIRVALGASRGRIARELLTEHLFLGAAAGLVGLALGGACVDVLVSLDAGRIPRLAEVSLDGSVLVFTTLVALGTSVLFGAAPLVQLIREASSVASGGTRWTTGDARQKRARSIFIASQMAVALVLLVGAGLFSTSLREIMNVDPGLDPTNVAAFRISLDPVEDDLGDIVRYYDGLLDRISALPGVIGAGASQTMPLNPVSNDFRRPYRPTGSSAGAADASAVQMRIVTPGYVETMGMTLISGDVLPAGATSTEPAVALVNQTLSDRLWPGADATGQTFEIDFQEGWQSYRVVGVVQDVKHYGPRAASLPEVFLAHGQFPYLAMNVVVKTQAAPETMFQDLRREVLAYRSQPPHDFVSVEELLAYATAEERFLSVLLNAFAALGLLLACTGVYGVISYSVGHRRREIGVRMALGAEPARVVGSVFAQTAKIAGVGLLLGLVGVAVLGRLVEGLLFGVAPNDPLITVGVATLLSLIAGLAAWLPARRAAWIQPAEVLRSE